MYTIATLPCPSLLFNTVKIVTRIVKTYAHS
jgi:hypothetical protein